MPTDASINRFRRLCASLCLLVAAPASGQTVYSFILEPGQVVPPLPEDGGGAGKATLATNEAALAFTITHDIADAVAATVRRAGRGSAGPVVFAFPSAGNPIAAVWSLAPQDVADLRAGLLYVQVDSSAFPGGAVRGQIDLNPDPQPGDVIFSEIMFNPGYSGASDRAAEWVELFNRSPTDIDIAGWYLQDEDAPPDFPCVPRRSGSCPSFVLRSGQTVVLIPDGSAGDQPTPADFWLAWDRPALPVVQLNPDGTAGGDLAGDGLAGDAFNDGDPANDLPLASFLFRPCNPNGQQRADNEILTLRSPLRIMDVVNFGTNAPWPAPIQGASMTLVPNDYPDAHDLSTFNGIGNDDGSHWRTHQAGDHAGGFAQAAPFGVYAGGDVGSPGYLFGATAGNQPPVALPADIAAAPFAETDVLLQGVDPTRPFLNFLLFFIKSVPAHGELLDVASNRLITPQDVAGRGYLMPRPPFNHVRYLNDGICAEDSFAFAAFDAVYESNIADVRLFTQCGDLAITELMYHSDSFQGHPTLTEWIELFNPTATPVDLTGWYIAVEGGRSGGFPPYVLGPESAVVVIPAAVDPGAFAAAWCHAPERVSPCPDDVLELTLAEGTNHFRSGDAVRLQLHQRGLRRSVRGFQAFLDFDPSRLQYSTTTFEGCPTTCPPALHAPYGTILRDAAAGGALDVAAGIDDFQGQSPTINSAHLVTFEFVAGTISGPTIVAFRPHDPPSRFSDAQGAELAPCLLRSPTIWIDDLPGACPANRLALQTVAGGDPVQPGDTVVVELRMSALERPVRGFQAFLTYDAAKLSHTATAFGVCPGSCPPNLRSPFNVILRDFAGDGLIDLAAGIDDLNGQTPTQADAILARLAFTALAPGGLAEIGFRNALPPSRFSDDFGQELLPCLVDAAPIYIDENPPPVRCAILQPADLGDIGDGSVAGWGLSDDGDTVVLARPGAPAHVADAVIYRPATRDGAWPDIGAGGPSIYVAPPALQYSALANDDPGAWSASTAGVDGAYPVTPNATFNSAPAPPPFASADVGSPAYLEGLIVGECGPTAVPGDSTGDGLSSLADWPHFEACLRGPEAAVPANCDCFDLDGDRDVDLADYAAFSAQLDRL